jgi:isocitrate lyase
MIDIITNSIDVYIRKISLRYNIPINDLKMLWEKEPDKEDPKKQDTGKFRTNTKDQFYTDEKVAETCIECILTLLPFTNEYLWVEPSAGAG